MSKRAAKFSIGNRELKKNVGQFQRVDLRGGIARFISSTRVVGPLPAGVTKQAMPT